MPCQNGAEVDPVFTLTTVALNVVSAGIAIEEGWLSIIPWLTNSPILGQQTTSSLCALNLDDPGDFQLSMLATPVDLNILPSYDSPPGSLNRWIWDKTAYFIFQRACRCIGTGTKPPVPITPTAPPGADRSPGDPANSDQLTRIENNQSTSSDALLTLYNMAQVGTTTISDLAFRSLPNLITPSYGPWIQMSGEGGYDIPPVDWGSGATTQDPFGLYVELTSIPATVARRGVTNQRLYGVGSIEWDVGDPKLGFRIVGQRDSLHYDRQFIAAPLRAQAYQLLWRLQPGVQAQARVLGRSTDSPFYTSWEPYNQAYQWYWNWKMPPGWSDKPFYPLSAAAERRVFPVPSPP